MPVCSKQNRLASAASALKTGNFRLARGTARKESGPTISRRARVTDHRIGLTLYDLDNIMEGDLDPIVDPLMETYQAELLSELSG